MFNKFNKMKNKIIAREIIIFFSALSLYLIICLFLCFRNSYYESYLTKPDTYVKQIDSLNTVYLNKDAEMFSDLFSLPESEQEKVKNNIFKGKSLPLLNQYFAQKDELDIKNKLDIAKKSNALSNYIIKKKLLKIYLYLAIGLMTIIYPLRICVILIKWALKIIKTV
jgi:hypothetical protein